MAYLTVAEFKLYTTMPSSFVDEVEARAPGYTQIKLDTKSAVIDSRLRKRYGAPYTDPTKVPIIVKEWLAALVTPDIFLKRGISGTDEQWSEYVKRADAANRDLELAANSETGLFDLPLHNDGTSPTGIVGGTLVYSEASPYVWTDVQAAQGRIEDDGHSGTSNTPNS
jgi:hypothetical protein